MFLQKGKHNYDIWCEMVTILKIWIERAKIMSSSYLHKIKNEFLQNGKHNHDIWCERVTIHKIWVERAKIMSSSALYTLLFYREVCKNLFICPKRV